MNGRRRSSDGVPLLNDAKPWHSDEDIGRYESLFPPLPNYSVKYQIGNHDLGIVIGLSDKHLLSFAGDILNAIIARQMGLSFSTVKQRYSREFTESPWLGLTDRIDNIYKYGIDRLRQYVSCSIDAAKSAESYQELSMQFFRRSLVSFDAAKRLAELGYLCEPAAILRAALEQIGFCSKAWSLDWRKKLTSIDRKEAIISLKSYAPPAGELYGRLSKYTHFEYDYQTHFLALSPSSIFTLHRSAILRAYATHLLLVTMVCSCKCISKMSLIQFDDLPAAVKDLDNFISQVLSYSNDVRSMFCGDEIFIQLHALLEKFVMAK